ncbi:hypothetical protein RHMOL_Rhmol09G0226400 [Rhododendron molle]|uniref:Uncharacterized protein n=1 Tax=Rhododendron molle TaxID=49168 RepID=A0ACC0MHF2_RHOML|nr:hypothetical protein RHMOL_Rhmol09G0226400 [Rhododendron molle]
MEKETRREGFPNKSAYGAGREGFAFPRNGENSVEKSLAMGLDLIDSPNRPYESDFDHEVINTRRYPDGSSNIERESFLSLLLSFNHFDLLWQHCSFFLLDFFCEKLGEEAKHQSDFVQKLHQLLSKQSPAAAIYHRWKERNNSSSCFSERRILILQPVNFFNMARLVSFGPCPCEFDCFQPWL